MKMTCSYLQGRYLDKMLFVRLIMNFDTMLESCFSLSLPRATSSSVAKESLLCRIGSSKFFLKSFLEPNNPGLEKFNKAKYSDRSF